MGRGCRDGEPPHPTITPPVGSRVYIMLPTTQKALQLSRAPEGSPKGTPNTVALASVPVPTPAHGQVLVRILAAGFNRRDEWSRHGLYPGLVYDNSTLGCDAAGMIVSQTGAPQDGLVLLVPLRGWACDPAGPGRSEADVGPNELGGRGFGILGATKPTGGVGTFCEYVAVDQDQVVPVPPHLDAIHAAALPCAATTAYRALFTKGQLQAGQTVLITGIGGGVAQLAAQLARAARAHVFVTAGSESKLDHAKQVLGVEGGALYKDEQWPKQLKQLTSTSGSSAGIDLVIDSAGGDILTQSLQAGLRDGGKVVCFGMTAVPKIQFDMRAVLRNVDLLGTTMGSIREFKEAIRFIGQHHIVPEIDTVLPSLDCATEGFNLLADASKRHGGKVVVQVAPTPGALSSL